MADGSITCKKKWLKVGKNKTEMQRTEMQSGLIFIDENENQKFIGLGGTNKLNNIYLYNDTIIEVMMN